MPSVAYARSTSRMTPANSDLIWSGVQKMCASLRLIARTRLSPPTTPDFS